MRRGLFDIWIAIRPEPEERQFGGHSGARRHLNLSQMSTTNLKMPLLMILCIVAPLVVLVDSFSGDALLSRQIRPTRDTNLHYGQTVAEIEAECEVLREEIKVLKAEALDKIDRLLLELNEVDGSPSDLSSSTPVAKTTVAQEEDDLLPAPVPITFTGSNENTSTSSKKPKKTISNLLDQVRFEFALGVSSCFWLMSIS